MPGYSCTYMNTISWAGETSPLPMEINPRVAFERMFGRAGDAEPAPARGCARTAASSTRWPTRRGSCSSGVGAQDRARLDDYLDNVREIERRIEKTEARNAASVTAVTAPVGVPETFEEHAALMFDLLAVAYQADLTRVFTFMMAREASQRTYPGARASPRRTTTCRITATSRTRWRCTPRSTRTSPTLFASFVEKLRTSPDGDGSVLDHSLIVFGGGMSDGQAHSPIRCRSRAVGGAGGRMKGNRFIVAPRVDAGGQPLAERGRHVRQPARAVRREQRAGSASDANAAAARASGCAVGGHRRVLRCAAALCRAARRARRSSTRSRAATAAGVRARLQQKADVNAAEADGTTALHWAVRADDLELTRTAAARGRRRAGAPTATA